MLEHIKRRLINYLEKFFLIRYAQNIINDDCKINKKIKERIGIKMLKNQEYIELVENDCKIL